MNENDDRQSEPPPPSQGPAPGAWLPPRLRQRLEDAEAEPIKTSATGTILGWAVLLAIIGAVVGGIMLIHHGEVVKAKAAAARAEQERLAAVADSIAGVRRADSLRAVAVADSIKAFEALPRWKQEVILAKLHPPSDSTTAVTDAEGHYTLDVGSFLFEDPAKALVESAKTKTKLTLRVVPIEDEGNTTYHVYAGNFTHKAEASFTANQLLQKGIVPQADVITLADTTGTKKK
ncbi:MAG TPA: SPOR domain-containing protein [Candidatus Sulfotelmatobacter sp.]|nr:SPOR domain-containing protein [Candidatus Sulfotelmatobacter sp.]